MHLRNTLLGTQHSSQDTSLDKNIKDKPITDNQDPRSLMEQELDLTVPSHNDLEEELEDEEITEDEKHILDQLDDLI